MPFSVYEASALAMIRGLTILDSYVDHAREFALAQNRPMEEVLDARLAPDMLSFKEQIGVLCNKLERHAAALARREPPGPAQLAGGADALKARIAQALLYIESLPADDFEGAQIHTFELSKPLGHGWVSGRDYIFQLTLPDLYFHLTTAHDILRNLGAPLGKSDYLGALDLHAGGYD